MDVLLQVVGEGPIFSWLAELMQSEVAKMTLAFMLAYEVHQRKMKKEAKEREAREEERARLLRQAIDHLSEVLGKRIDNLDARVEKLEKK